MTLVDNDHRESSSIDRRRFDVALAALVADDVLTSEQATAVRTAVAGPAPRGSATARSRLIEASAYLGAVLVAAGVLALVAQSWDSMQLATRLAVVVGTGAVAYAAGLVLGLAVGGGRAAVRAPISATRRRATSVLLTSGALLVAAGVPIQQDASERSFVLGAVVALVLVVPAQVLAPSAVSELALFGASVLALGQGLALLVPEQTPWEYVDYPPTRGWDYLVPGALLMLGLLWAWLVSRALTLPVLAQVLGLLLTLEAAIALATSHGTRPVGLATLGVLAVVGVVVFVRERGWPWLVLTVLSATVAVFVLVSEAADPALALLVSGVVLLALSGGATALGRRRASAPTTSESG